MISWRLYLYRILSWTLPETRAFALKAMVLRWCGAKIGHNVRINSSVQILGVGQLVVGDDVWIGPDSLLISGSPATISIGSQVDIGPSVCIVTGSHEVDGVGLRTAGRGYNKDVTIGDGAWIGCRSVILSGVTIGSKALVGAGSVVTKDAPACWLSAGVPAHPKKGM